LKQKNIIPPLLNASLINGNMLANIKLLILDLIIRQLKVIKLIEKLIPFLGFYSWAGNPIQKNRGVAKATHSFFMKIFNHD
jgi:hypothetical protein